MPKAYYNEIDLYCAEWLYNLQRENLIAPGDIDTRPIQDVRPSDLRGYTQHHFFAGIGGWSRALRQADWSDDREVWTGSCPCQPFSLAGKRGGFADDRHLWPYFRYLIAVERPSVVFGEQVASATSWLGLVRGDLEALGYAVGAMPVEAASAGADHLRDRFWFVADAGAGRRARSEGRQGEQPRRTEAIGASNPDSRLDLANGHVEGPQGWLAVSERAGERPVGQDGLADSDFAGESEWRQQRSGQLGGTGGDPQTRDSGDLSNTERDGHGNMADSQRNGAERDARTNFGEERAPAGARSKYWNGHDALGKSAAEYEWVLGADGKARRVKPGVRLLAHGVPNRVGKLRGFGNAIDPRPAAQFIRAFKPPS